jgi:hypothetical protein
VKYTNDRTTKPPSLRLYMHDSVLDSLPQFSGMDADARVAVLRAGNFAGIQFNGGTPEEIHDYREAGMGIAESGRINTPEDSDELARRFADLGAECATVHLGWGFEDDEEANKLIGALLEASAKHGIPLYPETHRATVLQDMWRTIGFAKRFPELRFNGDYSHWYTGLEMVYGDVEWKFDRIEPVFERVSFMHGRIGDPGAIQVEVFGANDHRSFVDHFREMWTRTFRSFLRNAQTGDYLCFTPEVLPASIFYSRTKLNEHKEEVEVADRWEQSLILAEIARDCFSNAQTEV